MRGYNFVFLLTETDSLSGPEASLENSNREAWDRIQIAKTGLFSLETKHSVSDGEVDGDQPLH